MVKARLGTGLALGCLLMCGMATSVQAAPAVAQILQYTPKMKGVKIDTPTAAEQANCEVKLIHGTAPGSSGWLLFDKTHNQTLRRFFDSDGDRKIDIYSYYKNGLEVYREVDTNSNNHPDQFRWLNGGGMKWGVDSDEDGKIDSWRMISAEEVAEEAFQAMMTRDFDRLKVLFVSETELQTLGLPKTYQDRIHEKLKEAQKRFQEIVAKLPAVEASTIKIRIESAAPQCVPGESIGVSKDLFRFPTRTILYPVSKEQFEILQTGEMLQVGKTWRLLDVPSPSGTTPPMPSTGGSQKVMDLLAKHDREMPQQIGTGPDQGVVDWNLKRASLIEQLLPTLPEDQKNIWLKQRADNLQQAAMHSRDGDTKAVDLLREFKEGIVRQNPGSGLASYVTYKLLWAEYAKKLVTTDTAKLPEYQAEWMKKLAEFVQTYPKAEDTPDALWQLAWGSEFSGKEDDAKKYYTQLAEGFPQHPMAAKAAGAIRRLNLVGNPLQLSGQTLSGQNYNVITQRGKVVLVYYWASYCTACADTFAKLKKLHAEYGPKGFEIVTVSLDDRAEQAQTFLQSNPVPGQHLFVPGKDGGMNSPLATHYGIMGLPTAFLVGRDGNVISRNIQINDLEDAIKKAVK